MHFLVAEDEEHSRAERVHLLRELEPGASVTQAEDGSIALICLERSTSDVVFLESTC